MSGHAELVRVFLPLNCALIGVVGMSEGDVVALIAKARGGVES